MFFQCGGATIVRCRSARVPRRTMGQIRSEITYPGGVLFKGVFCINHYSEQGCLLN
jgi:hypothetical protein